MTAVSTKPVASTTSSERMDPTVRARRGPRYNDDALPVTLASASAREFRAMTDGMVTRLPYPHLAQARIGNHRSPHYTSALLLYAGRRASLPRVWAERYVAFVRGLVTDLWAESTESPKVAAIREEQVEASGNVIEKRWALNRESIPEIDAAIEVGLQEIAAQEAFVASLRADKARLERGGR